MKVERIKACSVKEIKTNFNILSLSHYLTISIFDYIYILVTPFFFSCSRKKQKPSNYSLVWSNNGKSWCGGTVWIGWDVYIISTRWIILQQSLYSVSIYPAFKWSRRWYRYKTFNISFQSVIITIHKHKNNKFSGCDIWSSCRHAQTLQKAKCTDHYISIQSETTHKMYWGPCRRSYWNNISYNKDTFMVQHHVTMSYRKVDILRKCLTKTIPR